MRHATTQAIAAHKVERGDLLFCFEEGTDRPLFREVFEARPDRDGGRQVLVVGARGESSMTLYVTPDLCLTRRAEADEGSEVGSENGPVGELAETDPDNWPDGGPTFGFER